MAAVQIALTRDSFSTRSVSTGPRRDLEEGGDDEAEIWAALERLPTYDRVRTTILEKAQSSRRVKKPVKVKDVDLEHYVVNQIFKLKNPEVDNERFLSRPKKRIDDAGVEVPSIEVRYENVKLQGQMYVGARALPTLTNTLLNFFEMILVSMGLASEKKRDLTILEGVSGILKPSTVILLSDWRIYHGPLENVEEFFATCGFRSPRRKNIPDFLQEVTSFRGHESERGGFGATGLHPSLMFKMRSSTTNVLTIAGLSSEIWTTFTPSLRTGLP
ncbi:unnamed protein product [Calypogeia fissa]